MNQVADAGEPERIRRLREAFRAAVQPHLPRLEAQRRLGRRLFLAGAGGLVAVLGLLAWLLPSLGVTAVVFGAIVALLGWSGLRALVRTYRGKVRALVLPAVCASIGDLQTMPGERKSFDVKRFAKAGLLPRYDRVLVDDRFKGRHRGTAFEFAEVTLRRRGSKGRQRSVFHGLLFALRTPQPIGPEILLARDGGMLGNTIRGWLGKGRRLHRVPLPHPPFERHFELYSDDPAGAVAVVGPGFAEAMVAVAEAAGGPVEAAFRGEVFLLALQRRGDQFGIGGLFRPVAALETHAFLLMEEVLIAHRLIDFLHGDRPGRL